VALGSVRVSAAERTNDTSEELARALRRTVQGAVRFDDGVRGLYASDASNYRQVPIGVVTPCDVDDVVATVAACREHGVPVLSRGGGTSLAGQCCNTAVIMDFSRHMNQVVSIDPTPAERWSSRDSCSTRCATVPRNTGSPLDRTPPHTTAARSAA